MVAEITPMGSVSTVGKPRALALSSERLLPSAATGTPRGHNGASRVGRRLPISKTLGPCASGKLPGCNYRRVY
jgi:hypothetical protein